MKILLYASTTCNFLRDETTPRGVRLYLQSELHYKNHAGDGAYANAGIILFLFPFHDPREARTVGTRALLIHLNTGTIVHRRTWIETSASR